MAAVAAAVCPAREGRAEIKVTWVRKDRLDLRGRKVQRDPLVRKGRPDLRGRKVLLDLQDRAE